MSLRASLSVIAALTLATASLVWLAQTLLNARDTFAFEHVAAPEAVPEGAPFFAVATLTGPADTSVWLQLRICGISGSCTHSARQQVSAPTEPSLVRATRDLPPDDYLVSVLAQTRTRLGVIRTVSQADFITSYGH